MKDKDSVLRMPSDYHSKDHSFNLTVSFKILLVPLLTVMMSCSVVGAFETDDPYGPVVNCDADQPMDDLLKCVEEKYALMDIVDLTDRYRNIKYFISKNKKSIILNYPYREVISYPNIKEEIYDRTRFSNEAFLMKIDKYKNKKYGVMLQRGQDLVDYMIPQPERAHSINLISSGIYTQKFFRSYQSASRDILLTKNKGKLVIYTAAYEIIPLKNKKSLYIIHIVHHCELDTPVEMRRQSSDDYRVIARKYSLCGVNYAYFTKEINKNIEYRTSVPVTEKLSNQPWSSIQVDRWGTYVDYEKHPDKIIHLSADKRENPTKLYIQLDGKNLEIDLKQ
ncbi:MAG: hypothetical protein IJ525_07090 [Alphaproteobacteria bacterium]|nr:hypothetical protein [Alphaproteobacteria bacterium]